MAVQLKRPLVQKFGGETKDRLHMSKEEVLKLDAKPREAEEKAVEKAEADKIKAHTEEQKKVLDAKKGSKKSSSKKEEPAKTTKKKATKKKS